MKVGILTSGGDAPGINATIRGVGKTAINHYGMQLIGIQNGFSGILHQDIIELTDASLSGILNMGGTILGTAREKVFRKLITSPDEADREQIKNAYHELGFDCLVCIGGNGTQRTTWMLSDLGLNVIGIPKTIDNDVEGTDLSIGFHTAVNIATEAIDRVHTTAEYHNRVMIVEVMGRSAGWIAVNAGIAGGAEIVLAPEDPFDIDKIVKFLKHRHRAHANFSIIVVAEGAVPAKGTSMDYETQKGKFGEIIAGAVSERLAAEISDRTGFDTRVTVLGHVQRGGIPTPTDRILGSRFGVAAIDALSRGESEVMTALRGEEVVLVPFSEVAGKTKYVPEELITVANALA